MLSYSWYRDTIEDPIRSDFRWYTFVSNDGNLYFQFVTMDDQGNYYCVVKRPGTMDNSQEGKTSMPIPLRVIDSRMYGSFIKSRELMCQSQCMHIIEAGRQIVEIGNCVAVYSVSYRIVSMPFSLPVVETK